MNLTRRDIGKLALAALPAATLRAAAALSRRSAGATRCASRAATSAGGMPRGDRGGRTLLVTDLVASSTTFRHCAQVTMRGAAVW